ncbi:TnsA-like heteromeric transposase endonuclease subunit [Kitasatospora purpeofusca]|uniref:TnsA-like heteromeric transposase endonuclease subunit n=1 Tax=Kitasatospora purpeofusca TaxID=67352 RepID=UPI002250557F|nr:TnsA-like heteromeric transposase endonuclease subunit [Kitasatospora purpeofusca]MCX4755102.1 TnsA-like heteromeric transposase endonuclease subunit [Kitasatospora purpeofusca]WSR29498.1 TnsA-like heteromeric transposase endonuclease subunit [Kitasatospora purpeofusca]WSR37001.1 TnsA-like heteromeric transposase endonuclease subunit [Kitasatospora purpeofusca]
MGDPVTPKALIRSDACGLLELACAYDDSPFRDRLRLGDGWTRRWRGTWLVGGGKVAWPVRDMAGVPVLSSRPVRGFTWRARQGHRPGLQFMVSTGRHHGFESLEEQRLLLVLDFLRVAEVLPQPFTLDFEYDGGRARHTPDFLAVLPRGDRWLFDVRPHGLVKDADAVKFAAAREAAEACGWAYTVVTGWRPLVWSVLDHLSSQRRPLTDRLGLEPQLHAAVRGGPRPFGEVVESTSLPVVARAHAAHLLWHRRLGVDLGSPLGDGSLLWPGGGPAEVR